MRPARLVTADRGVRYLAIFRHQQIYVIRDTAAESETAVWAILLDRYGGSIDWLRRQGFEVVEDCDELHLAPAFPW